MAMLGFCKAGAAIGREQRLEGGKALVAFWLGVVGPSAAEKGSAGAGTEGASASTSTVLQGSDF